MTRDEIPHYLQLSMNPIVMPDGKLQCYIYVMLKYRGYPDRSSLFHYAWVQVPTISPEITLKDYGNIIHHHYEVALEQLLDSIEETYPQGLDDLVSPVGRSDDRLLERIKREGIIRS
jgi:hypothetical protein